MDMEGNGVTGIAKKVELHKQAPKSKDAGRCGADRCHVHVILVAHGSSGGA